MAKKERNIHPSRTQVLLHTRISCVAPHAQDSAFNTRLEPLLGLKSAGWHIAKEQEHIEIKGGGQ